MMLLPSRGRPEQLRRFFEQSRPAYKGVVLLDEDDVKNYFDVRLPNNWTTIIAPRVSLTRLFNRAFEQYPDEPFYGLLGDDIVCKPKGWDHDLAAAAGQHDIAYGDDGINGRQLCCFPFLGGELVRATGWLQHPALGHLYGDSVWFEIGRRLKLLRYRPTVETRHFHWSLGLQEKDATARERQIEGDIAAFNTIISTEMDAIVERVRARISPPSSAGELACQNAP